MKKTMTAILLLSALTGSMPSTSLARKSGVEFRLCAVCASGVPRKSIQLPCDHPVCDACLQPWLDKKVMCLHCQGNKQRSVKNYGTWKSTFFKGVGVLAGVVIIGAVLLDERMSLGKGRLGKWNFFKRRQHH